MLSFSDRLGRVIQALEPEGDVDTKIERLLTNELVRRLNRYELADRRFQQKYGMTFEQFQAREVVKQRGYSFEVESDFWDWEMALDGIATVRELLNELKGQDSALD
jgi:hypothetical protein